MKSLSSTGLRKNRTNQERNGTHLKLTAAQRQILRLILKGRKAKEIAAEMRLSISAVNHQKERLRDKFNAENSAALGFMAAQYFEAEEESAQKRNAGGSEDKKVKAAVLPFPKPKGRRGAKG